MKKLIGMMLVMATLFSCKKEKEEVVNEVVSNPETGYLHGKFLVNEGSFGSNNASISYINETGELANDIFLQVNGFELGDVLQSFLVIGEKGYAVLNGSQKVEVIDMKTMQHIDAITGVSYPRHIIDLGNGSAFLTDGSNEGNIRIIDLSTNEITGSIPVGMGPEKMIKKDQYVYVCNSGGWGLDHTISVIDINTDLVVATIEVGDRPMDLVVDNQGYIWVMCSGNDSWMTGGETMASLYRINTESNSVITSEVIGAPGVHPKVISATSNGEIIYFENNGVRSIALNADEPVESTFLTDAIGSLDIDPANGDVWISSVSDFVNPSTVKCYSSIGTLKSSYEAGIGTSAVVFN